MIKNTSDYKAFQNTYNWKLPFPGFVKRVKMRIPTTSRDNNAATSNFTRKIRKDKLRDFLAMNKTIAPFKQAAHCGQPRWRWDNFCSIASRHRIRNSALCPTHIAESGPCHCPDHLWSSNTSRTTVCTVVLETIRGSAHICRSAGRISKYKVLSVFRSGGKCNACLSHLWGIQSFLYD